jgi:dolichol kinase
MNGQKTAAGSTGFLISALLVAIAWGIIYKLNPVQIIQLSIITSLIATAAEMISIKGLDNLTVPLATLACLLFLRSH